MIVKNISPASDKTDQLDAVLPEKTRLYIGPGISIKGDIRFIAEEVDQRLVICGEFEGNISTNGTVQITEGAVVRGEATIDCGEIVVGGTVSGANVTMKAQLLYLLSTGNISVEKLCLPPGGLEQSRGGVLNTRLDMSEDYSLTAETNKVKHSLAHDKLDRTTAAGASASIPAVRSVQNQKSDKQQQVSSEAALTGVVIPNFSAKFDSPNAAPDLKLPGEKDNRA